MLEYPGSGEAETQRFVSGPEGTDEVGADEGGGPCAGLHGYADTGPLCNGLSRYTNQELPWVFPEVLRGRTVID